MDEELVVKAPVTRLRRRLSTEVEGAQSPLTPSTPTKKRGARIAKPALELIDEIVTESVPKKVTRRTSTKDVEMEEKPVTPARRSTRIRSNTSLLMEATQNIVSESPRAKRALRRNSQIGSDTESGTTPARRTRTRKDSTSSVEKLTVTNSNEKIVALVAEAISEEPEKEITKDSTPNVSQNSTPLRKSPRLSLKSKNTRDKEPEQNDNALANLSKLTEDASSSLNGQTKIDKATLNTHDNTSNKSNYSEIQNLSLNSAKRINDISTNPKVSADFNKTVPAIEEFSSEKGNRKRTKSWTTITANDAPSENINSPTKFASGDSGIEKVGIISPNKSINKSVSMYNTSIENKENIHILKAVQTTNAIDTLKILEKTPSKDLQSVVFMEDSDTNSSSGKLTIDMDNDGGGGKSDGGDQCVPFIKQTTPKRLTSESFVVEPMDIDETIPENVTINDFSDKSNSSKEENQMSDLKQSSPFSKEKSTDINKSPSKSTRTSSISLQQESNYSNRKSSITVFEKNNDYNDALDKSQRKSSVSILYENDKFTDNGNKSKRKSSLSKVDLDNNKNRSSTSPQVNEKRNESLNKSKRKSIISDETEIKTAENASDGNKSTLVLSQLKDLSTNEASNISKSPNDTNNKSIDIPTKQTSSKAESNYLTSTPLHQKSLQKVAMQINTSIISPNVANTSKVNKSKTPVKNVSNASLDSSSSEESDEEDSRRKSKIIDDEAEEASDDYESGDSRTAEERQYEQDHEIKENGETLESDENVSDDTDYEKDSFVVSSNEEDDDLLSGSGDDLSLTDNELKMTAKSKNKFDERKRKEQKNASREMYEARHQLNESDSKSKSKSKKPKGKKIESSASESEEEVEIQTKKKNRMRINSSHDASMNNSEADDESVNVKKKKAKRLSESVCEDNPNEKEITIQNHSLVEKNDPLAVAIKHEPKTPRKDFDMSTVLINDNIEQVQVDTNASVMIPDEALDPLQATLAPEEESDSDISENMEIQENYDSVLENLNQVSNKERKIKTTDTSLNLNKKRKEKINEPIIDQLNLTQTKSKKKNTLITLQKAAIKSEVSTSDKHDDDDNSDSIDMRLLFPEDSNDSEVNGSIFKPDKNEKPADEFIPLKKVDAKTNLRESTGETEDAGLHFFIDTKGAFEDLDISTETSAKKNKKKHKHNVSVINIEVIDDFAVPENTSVNDSLKKDKKKKKKNKSFDVSQTDEEPVLNLQEVSSRYEQANIETTPVNVSGNSDKKKKKNKSHLDVSGIVEDAASEATPTNVSVNSDKKKKKNNSHLDVSGIVEHAASEATPTNVSVNSDKKKKKNNSQLDVSGIVEHAAAEETPINVSVNSEKKKKKNKSLIDVSQTVEVSEETSTNVSMNSEKKKKKNKSHLNVSQTVEDAAPEESNVSVDSKKKKRKNKSQTDISQTSLVEEAVTEESPIDVSKTANKKKKKNKSLDVSNADENNAFEETKDAPQKKEKKNKKNKSLDAFQTVDNTGEDSDDAPVEVAYKSEKKSDNPEPIEEDDTNKSKNKFKKKKKKVTKILPQTDLNTDQGEVKAKKRKHDQSLTEVHDGEVPMSKSQKKKKLFQNDEGGNSIQEGSTSKSIKRKANEEDGGQRNSKVFKSNFFEKIHVPRLPDSIVNQLDDKPSFNPPKSKKSKKKKKGKAISTLPFEVEEGPRRKNKPSNYLEESIYLNDSVSPLRQKKKIKNPKVLPFTPTVITSGKGYTSKFKINVLPEETEYFAQAKTSNNFREDFLSKQRAKKIKVEHFKKQRNLKLSKF